jgi:hypothetical protein
MKQLWRCSPTDNQPQTIIPWNTDTQQTVTRICTVVGHNFTREEWSQLAPGIPYHQTCS